MAQNGVEEQEQQDYKLVLAQKVTLLVDHRHPSRPSLLAELRL